MAGEIHQQPFSLTFQGSSIHSGSISFGRFEKEGLSWERRSSFSHNKYLEEVDKCSKPGSVTEMKAHFEAHFKKKGTGFRAALESQTWGVRQTSVEPDDDAVFATESIEDCRSEGSISENTSQSDSPCNYSHEQEKFGKGKSQCEYDEQSDHCVSYDEILVNSDDVIELDEEAGGDHGTPDVPVECKDLGTPLMPLEIEIQDLQDSVAVKETGSKLDQPVPAEPSDVTERPSSSSSSASESNSLEHVKPISPHALNVTKASTKKYDVTPIAALRRTKGSSLTSNSKTDIHSAKSDSRKEIRPKKTIVSRPLTSKKTETRTPIATNRSKTGTCSTKLEMSTAATGFRFKINERAQKRKEYYMKLEEKKSERNQVQAKTQQKVEAEMKQFRKSLNFKATPMPSFYNTNSRPGSHNKTESSKIAPSRPRTTNSALVTNRVVTRVCYNTKHSAAKDSDLRKSNLLAVESKPKIGARKSGK